MRVRKRIVLLTVVGAIGLGCTAALAGHFACDFNSDPSSVLTIIGSGEWRPDDGFTGKTGDGYLAITDAINNQRTKIIFDDFDQGLVVKAFTFSCDLRIGSPVGCSWVPADGFSLNYVRTGPDLTDPSQTDPLISVYGGDAGGGTASADGWSGSAGEPGYPDGVGLPEEGATTGISVGFDTWDNGDLSWPSYNSGWADVVGMMVRVDNHLVSQTALETRNGACDDITSLQTGPYSEANPGDRSVLCWQPFKVQLGEDGKLTVTWKGRKVLDAYQTTYAPSQGRLVFGGRTGGCNENTDMDNLVIDTIPADTLVIGAATGTPVGFDIVVVDSGPAVGDPNTAKLTLDGTAVTANYAVHSGTGTTIRYWDLAKPLVAGSTHTVGLSIKDTRGIEVSADRSFTVPAYVTVPPERAVANVDTSKRGFKVRAHFNPASESFDNGTTYQTRAGYTMDNTVARAMEQLFGLRGLNKLWSLATPPATETTAAKDFVEANVINYSFDVQSDLVSIVQYGAFQANANDPGGPNDWPDVAMWGIDPALDTSNIACDIQTYVYFPEAGVYHLIFNSDDGFRTTCDPQIGEVLTSLLVGEADYGRGASDTVSILYVPQAGYYPMRTVWEQGGGGSNLEWSGMEQVPAKNPRALLNADVVKAEVTTALKCYRETTAPVPAGITFIDPARNSGNPYPPDVVLRVEITDGSAGAVDQGSIVLQLDGAAVTPTKSYTAPKTELTYTPPDFLASGSSHTMQVTFTGPGGQSYLGTNAFTILSYTTIPPSMALPAAVVDKNKPGFLIKTVQQGIQGAGSGTNPEDYPGNSTYVAETMIHGLFGWPNTADLSAFTGPGGYYEEAYVINYNGASGNIGNFPDPNAPNVPGIPGTAVNENGFANYAQEILTVLDFTKAGLYCMGVNSDDGFRTTVGNPNEATRRGRPMTLGEYDGGRGASDTLFYFRILTPGLYPFRTLWEEGGGGNNVEWFMVTPTQQRVLINDVDNNPTTAIKAYQYPLTSKGSPWIKYFTPVRNTAYFNSNLAAGFHTGPDAGVKIVLEDGETAVTTESVKMQFDRVDVTPTVTKTGTETTATYQPPAPLEAGSTHRVDVWFLDRRVNWSFSVGPLPTPKFFIQAADFNYDSGKTVPAASVMPYDGTAYAGLGGVVDVDLHPGGDGDQPWYRFGYNGGVPMSLSNDRDRGVCEVACDFRIGWVGGGQWWNYTRDFPAGAYNVYAAISYDGTGAGQCHATLQEVAGATTSNQTLTPLGIFDAPGTHDIGGWGANALVPLKDAGGNMVELTLGGAKTLRYSATSGDWDYMLFIPPSAVAPKITKVQVNTDGTLTIEWTGGGTLQYTASLTPPIQWTDVTGQQSPFTFQPPAKTLFGRIKK